MKLSVIIPSYNAASWLPRTLEKLHRAIIAADIKSFEIIIVDDGSTDLTKDTVAGLPKKYRLKLLSQRNKGRYVARKKGINAAKFDNILLIDTRVFIGQNALKYVKHNMSHGDDKIVWNAHVNIDKNNNPFTRFWDAIAQIAWRKYFKQPRDISYGTKDFDKYPKGTTAFFAPKTVLLRAIERFEKTTGPITTTTNDDTAIIRLIAEDHRIHVSPKFDCLYHARTDARQFVKHAFHRGQVFVDGFLRPGNRFYLPLISFIAVSAALPLVVIYRPDVFTALLASGVSAWLIGLVVVMGLLRDKSDGFSLWILAPLFSLVYGAGIWRAVLKRHNWLLIVLSWAMFLSVHFSGVIGNIGDRLYDGYGDHTAGLIWLYDQDSADPWWGFTDKSNYPDGESLWNPTFVSGQITYLLFWMLSKAAFDNPVAGYNLVIFLYMLASYTAVLMLCRWLRVPAWLAIFAAYAAVFNQYLIDRARGGHISYVAVPGLIALITWLCLKIFAERSRIKRSLVELCAVVAGLLYFDGYVLLICVVYMAGLCSAILIHRLWQQRKLRSVWPDIKRGLVIVLALVAAIAPAQIYLSASADETAANIASTRPDIYNDAMIYSARIKHYLLPSMENTLYPEVLTERSSRLRNVEQPLFLGYAAMVTWLAVALSLFLWSKRKANNGQQAIFWYLTVAMVLCVLFSFPPQYTIYGLSVQMPTALILELTNVLRVFARFFAATQTAFYISLVLGLALILRMTTGHKRTIIQVAAGMVAVISFFELMYYHPRHLGSFWSYSGTSFIYHAISNDDSQQAIALYPMREYPSPEVLKYTSNQYVFQKPMLNPATANRDNAPIRLALESINAPQTVPTLAKLGITSIIAYTTDEAVDFGSYVKVIAEDSEDIRTRVIWLAIDPLAEVDFYRYLPQVENGGQIHESESWVTDISYTIQEAGKIIPIDVCAHYVIDDCAINDNKPSYLSMDIELISDSHEITEFVQFYQGDNELATYTVGKGVQRIRLPLSGGLEPVMIKADAAGPVVHISNMSYAPAGR